MVATAIGLLAQIETGTVLMIIAGVAIAVVAAWAALAYNGLIRGRNLVHESWSGIDVQFKRRHDLIPNLVETVKGYADFERGLLEKITNLRARASSAESLEERQQDENALTGALKQLFAVAEAYPQLRANKSFLDLQRQLAEIEDQLQSARRYYNATVRDYNTRIESVPSNLIANVFRFETAAFFEVETATERSVPQVKF